MFLRAADTARDIPVSIQVYEFDIDVDGARFLRRIIRDMDGTANFSNSFKARRAWYFQIRDTSLALVSAIFQRN